MLIDIKISHPQIYVFKDRHEHGWLKIGETTRKNVDDPVDPDDSEFEDEDGEEENC